MPNDIRKSMNKVRAESGKRALFGHRPFEELGSVEERAIDAMVDILHYVHSEDPKVDSKAILRMVQSNFEEEVL